ncbi:hypothetical protein JCM19314_1020 [Nonlabens ulvanivorans]|uniref:DUF4126 domain-containing protein n=1 Tax=Nonlabens ulvanivorans TaxID=906888 RepID=A0A090QA10_NONUL|nr:DUF4126 domain-containing protein [Nonlabens ulvanivorans]GAK99835.1 hypothetical protein JCM19314_1020 [Nonlabens ulvanivorans]
MEWITSNFEIFVSICLGIGLSASAGFRVFVPLLFLSIAAYMGMVPLNPDWAWAGSLSAVLILGVAAIVELMAYYIPYVDNLLDAITVPLAAIAGTAVMVSVVGDLDPVYTWTLAIIAGGGTAASVASTAGAARLTSTATTGGIGNPVISTAEAGFSGILSFLSLIAPIFAAVIVVLIFIAIRKLYKKLFKKKPLPRKPIS